MTSQVGPQIIVLKKVVTTGGTQVPLSATILIVGHEGAFLQADKDNTNYIYMGGSGVDNTYPALSAAQTTPIPVGTDLSNIWIDADTDGEGVAVLYYK